LAIRDNASLFLSFTDIWLQDSNNGGEIQTRMTFTLIGNYGSKGFCDSVLPTTVVHAPLVCAEAGEAPTKKTEDKVETPPASESKDKVEAGNETQEPAKEGQEEAKADKPDAAPSLEDKVDKPDAAPSSEDKSGALHATAWWRTLQLNWQKEQGHFLQQAEMYHGDDCCLTWALGFRNSCINTWNNW